MPAIWKEMPHFALTLPDRPGELAHFMAQLRDAGISLMGLWGYGVAGRSEGSNLTRIACVPESPESFRLFFKPAGLHIEEGRVFFLSDLDRRGALVETLRKVADAGINVDSIECVVTGDRFGCFLWPDEGQFDALRKLLMEGQKG